MGVAQGALATLTKPRRINTEPCNFIHTAAASLRARPFLFPIMRRLSPSALSHSFRGLEKPNEVSGLRETLKRPAAVNVSAQNAEIFFFLWMCVIDCLSFLTCLVIFFCLLGLWSWRSCSGLSSVVACFFLSRGVGSVLCGVGCYFVAMEAPCFLPLRCGGNSVPHGMVTPLPPSHDVEYHFPLRHPRPSRVAQVPKGATEILQSKFQPLSSLVTVEDAPQPMEL